MARLPENEEPKGLDPIALTLAVWLGLIAGTTGLVRMSQDAAARMALAQAAATQPGSGTAKAAEPTPLFSPRLMAFGG